jgi:hypothetical protein
MMRPLSSILLLSHVRQQMAGSALVILVYPEAHHSAGDAPAAWRWQTPHLTSYAKGTQVLTLLHNRCRVAYLRYRDLMPVTGAGNNPQ